MNKIIATLGLVSAISASHVVMAQVSSAALSGQDLVWQSITFGQSTDLNFGSTILPEKVGVNQVTVDGERINPGPLANHFSIESRGGKLANSHEGVTFYYTEIPTNVNFSLSAEIEMVQLGPETGATPNRQEGAGIMVRDIIGSPRLDPQPAGHEEFPAAANMVMNLLRSHSRENDQLVNINASYREGVYQPWGTAGNKLSRVDVVKGLPYGNKETYKLGLTRTDTGFNISYDDGKTVHQYPVKGANANLVQMQNADSQYVGFFASRNAKINVSKVQLDLAPAETQDAAPYQAELNELVVRLAASPFASVSQHPIQAQANYSGTYTLTQQGKVIAEQQRPAGESFLHQVDLIEPVSQFELSFKASEGPQLEPVVMPYQVTLVEVADPKLIYVASDAKAGGDGSLDRPLSFTDAVLKLAPGGTLILADGDYDSATVPVTVSGTPDAVKSLKAAGDKVRFVGELVHQANHWHYDNIEVAGASFIVHGSHNQFDHMITHGAPDTGFQITSPEGIGRALWASHNLVTNSESFNNMDPSRINADGFAAKMRIGEGNTFIGCISHHNADDGWDLFNKVEDGPNGAVTIINSIAFNNGQTLTHANAGGNIGNGFKLGGEGIPVPHVIKNSLAFNNNMDGFTDNFNPGAVTVENTWSIDNKRFNYIFRKSPYDDEIKQGTFNQNRSWRLHQLSKYADVVNGDSLLDNQFIQQASLYSQGEQARALKALAKVDLGAPVPGRNEAIALQQRLLNQVSP